METSLNKVLSFCIQFYFWHPEYYVKVCTKHFVLAQILYERGFTTTCPAYDHDVTFELSIVGVVVVGESFICCCYFRPKIKSITFSLDGLRRYVRVSSQWTTLKGWKGMRSNLGHSARACRSNSNSFSHFSRKYISIRWTFLLLYLSSFFSARWP